MTNLDQQLTEANIQFSKNEDLSKHSTMRVGGKATYWVEITSENEIIQLIEILSKIDSSSIEQQCLQDDKIRMMVLGGGSNTLFTGDFNGIIVHNNIQGKELIHEDEASVSIKVGGGEDWPDFVEYCVDRNWAGIENLALIPGTIGAAPVQNIAAYGQVQEDTFVELEAVDLQTGEKRVIKKKACGFEYRTSKFKKEWKGKYFITNVTYKLAKVSEYIPDTTYHSRYESLSEVITEIAEPPYTLRNVFDAVVKIRKMKLPQPDEVGTLGSFFMNPFVDKHELEKLREQFPEMQYYPVDKMQYPQLDEVDKFNNSDAFKIPIGWVLEELGFRGKRLGNVGSSKKHSLIVTVEGPATGEEVVRYMEEIMKTVQEKTGLEVESEINVV